MVLVKGLNMNELNDKIIYVAGFGLICLLILSGVMAQVFVTYVRSIINKLDHVMQIEPLLKKVEDFVSKVDALFTKFSVTEKATEIKLLELERRIEKLESRIDHE